MTVRIGWDEYEVALLIDACNRIRDNKIDKAECVHKLSNLLRQRAKANGINIDEVFRNENGIALQMTKMEYLLTDGKKGLPGASKLYIEMAKMSKLNSDEFEKILILAKEQIGYKEAMNNMNTREKFIQWLSSNPISKYSSNTIVNALDEGSEYCCSRSLSKVSFWDMNNKNEFITVASKLLGMKIYRLMHKKTAIVLDKAVPLYKKFLQQSEKRSGIKIPDVEISTEGSGDNVEAKDNQSSDSKYSQIYQKLYYISKVWDSSTGGYILTPMPLAFSKEPRPVYYKELDILGFDKYWDYDKNDSFPYMWAEANNYYYRGRLVAKTKGGSLYTPPELVLIEDPEPEGYPLRFVDIPAMVDKNRQLMEQLVQETIKKIYNTFIEYQDKVDVFYVAFSGGKDSVVALDLVQRALPHNCFKVLFGDTGMEFPDTYETVEKIKQICAEEKIEFLQAKSKLKPENTWQIFGPPAVTIRWCCSVHKTTPQIMQLREVLQKPDFTGMAFTGVRGDESLSRSEYDAISYGGKHSGQYSCHPILEWNTAELFLYIYENGLTFNNAYKKGNTRAGCLVCPMSQGKHDYMKYKNYPDDTDLFINKIITTSGKNFSKENYDRFVEQGYWRTRKSGRELSFGHDKHVFEIVKGQNVITVQKKNEYWKEWAKTIGQVTSLGDGEFSIAYEGKSYAIRTISKELVFIWDEFSEYFENNMHHLTGFQQVAELAATAPFCLLIVTHKAEGYFSDGDPDKRKILDRFVSPIHISLPENIAFELMHEALKVTDDVDKAAKWEKHRKSLEDRTMQSRSAVSKKIGLTDKDLSNVLPIHPYAALILQHISIYYTSTARSMFNFIKNDEGEDVKAFQWFIDRYDFSSQNPFVTIDMLWNFFYETGSQKLADGIREVLSCYTQKMDKELMEDEKRVLKVILLLQAISERMSGNRDIFLPNNKNLTLAFEGTDLEFTAQNIAKKLLNDHVVTRTPLTGDVFSYCCKNMGPSVDPGPFIAQAKGKGSS